MQLYRNVFGKERAAQLWDAAFKRYSQEVSYLSRFQGDKAQGVRAMLRNDLQILGLLNDQALNILEDQQRAGQVQAAMQPFASLMYN